MQLVVSRYNEDIGWTKNFDNVIIYNKGPHLGLQNEIQLPNVGREAHTYLCHIINNYDNLDDYTVFLQGNPFDHSPNLFERLRYIHGDAMFISEHILYTTVNGCFHHKEIPMRQTYHQLFGETLNHYPEFVFGAGAQFVVSRDRIRERPLSFYENALNLVKYDICPLEAYTLERYWTLIFNIKP